MLLALALGSASCAAAVSPSPAATSAIETTGASAVGTALAGGRTPVALATSVIAHTCAAPYPSGPATTDTVFCADPSKMEDARVLRIVDGDTVHVELNGHEEIIRFYGIDTTERGEPCFEEGAQRTTQLVGQEVRLLPDARERDRYGRLLRYVYTPSGLSVDAEMVDEGMAHAWRQDGALRSPIIQLEDAARAARRGCLWQ